MALLISSGGEQLLHLADAVHHHALILEHPDWRWLGDFDPAEAAASRRRLLERVVTDRLRVFGYHLPFPGLGHIRARGNAFEWVARPWEW